MIITEIKSQVQFWRLANQTMPYFFEWKWKQKCWHSLRCQSCPGFMNLMFMDIEVNDLKKATVEGYIVISLFLISTVSPTCFLIFLCFHCSITVVVGNTPSSDPSGRLILLPKASAQDSGLSGSKRAKKKSDHKVGSLVEAEVNYFHFRT